MHMSDLENCIETYGRDVYSFCCHITHDRQEADDLYQDTFLTAAEIADRLDMEGNPKSALLSVAVNLWRNRCRKMAWRQRITGPVLSLDDLAGEANARYLRPNGGLAHDDMSHGGVSHGEPAHGDLSHGSLAHGGSAHGGSSHGSLAHGSLAHGSLAHGGEPISTAPSPLDVAISRDEALAVRRAVASLPDRYRLPVLLYYMEEMKLSDIAKVLHIPQGTVKSRLHKAKKLLAVTLKEVFDEM